MRASEIRSRLAELAGCEDCTLEVVQQRKTLMVVHKLAAQADEWANRTMGRPRDLEAFLPVDIEYDAEGRPTRSTVKADRASRAEAQRSLAEYLAERIGQAVADMPDAEADRVELDLAELHRDPDGMLGRAAEAMKRAHKGG